MELRRLRYFVAVAEERNFSRAARRLHIAQPPLSMQIRTLETELGVQLFERTHRPVRLTRAGASFLTDARRILADAEAAQTRARNAGQGRLGNLNLGFIPPLANDLLASIVREFRSHYPSVEINFFEMDSFAQVNALLAERIDVGFLRPVVQHAELAFHPVFSDSMVLAVPADHVLSRRKMVPWEDLREVPLILLNPNIGRAFYDDFLARCNRQGTRIGAHQIANDIHTSLWLVSAGFGVVPTTGFMQTVKRPNLAFRLLPPDAPTFQIAMGHRQKNPNPVLKNFFSVARALLAKTAPA